MNGVGRTLLDLDDVEVDDPRALATLVADLRARAAAGERLLLRNCPQLLAHALYKVALLEGEDPALALELPSVRWDQPVA
jgi:hypothetical protein